jgi:hypothetical protein
MSVAQADIERIVREVVGQLKLASAPVAAPTAAVDVPPADSTKDNGGLRIDACVVTLESVAGRLNGAKQLVVAPGALVTPSVRDELRRRGIELVERSSGKKTEPHVPVLLVAGRTGHDPEMAVQALRQDGIEVRTESTPCLVEATAKLAAAVAARSLGVLWTRHTAAGLCLANRHAAIRAVLSAGVSATSVAVATVGANVLVVDPAAGTLYEKKQVMREFCLGGVRECPEELRNVLSTEY